MNRSMNKEFDYETLRIRVLNWLNSLKTSEACFRMDEDTDGTLYTTCFALFLYDLFRETDSWSEDDRQKWADRILENQDPDTGYFIPEGYVGELETKPVQQLTGFCLSALTILDATPRYDLAFLEKWCSKKDIYTYLDSAGCFEGLSTTGNMAMFLGIFLTYQCRILNSPDKEEFIQYWFEIHDRTQNPDTGFWGQRRHNRYYAGFQNSFHQFVVYNYWKKNIQYHDRIVDKVLSLCDRKGQFGIVPGGGGCYDYDAADILIQCGIKNDYRTADIVPVLENLFKVILKFQNEDGGFSDSFCRPESFFSLVTPSVFQFCFQNLNPFISYYRFRSTVNAVRQKNRMKKDHWTKGERCWHKSDLWNTWFRCLTLAEIDTALTGQTARWKFHECIGLGHFSL